jgi:hypothetical protein
VSQIFAPVQVRLAALYAISYIYTGRYDHASAVALRGDGAYSSDALGRYVTNDGAVASAYRYYRHWFAKVRQVGLAEAQSKRVNPLDGSGLEWY